MLSTFKNSIIVIVKGYFKMEELNLIDIITSNDGLTRDRTSIINNKLKEFKPGLCLIISIINKHDRGTSAKLRVLNNNNKIITRDLVNKNACFKINTALEVGSYNVYYLNNGNFKKITEKINSLEDLKKL